MRYILQLPLMWSMELVVLYALLLVLKPEWVSIPLQIYFVLVGCQTLYTYIKAKLGSQYKQTRARRATSGVASLENSELTVKAFSMLITALVALCYGLHFLSDDATKAGSQGHAFW